jgi:HAMP domain-containing protein
MTPPFRSPAPSVGRFTALVLTLVVLVCVSMIGATGYLKFEMDRAETLLAAPDTAVGNDQDMFDRLRRILGYGGFLGLAQNYASHHDASGFADMKADIKSADDIVAHLPEKTPAEVRHDLTAIVASFDTALQKINAPANEQNEFVSADLMPLYAAVPVLDERVASANAETRLAAQNQMQFWGMLLTLVSWASLIIASACAAGIYLTLRDKQSAPMRALAQSIQNMARGDMRTAIWGTERQDMIGELARAVDTARYHFSHLPDLSLLSEQGPVRMRFEGGSRSRADFVVERRREAATGIHRHAVGQGRNSIAEYFATWA